MRLRYLCALFLLVFSAAAVGQPMTTLTIPGFLNQPLLVTTPPGDTGRAFIVERSGAIKVLDLATDTVQFPAFLTVPNIDTFGEGGLLGLAFHPQFAQNGYFYVYYTKLTGGGLPPGRVIARYRVSQANPNLADPASARIVLFVASSDVAHDGGWTEFGPDGYLYTGWGDDSAPNNAQTITNNLWGKILRLDVNGPDGVPGTADDDGFPADTNKNYCIPADNPFVGVTGDDEIWIYGLRNPWRCSFDGATGNLWIADVGNTQWEEIDVVGPGIRGLNMGWPCMEGQACNTFPTGCICNAPGLTLPIYVYSHSDGCAIQGGMVYHGCDLPSLRGQYIFADYCRGRIWSLAWTGVGDPVVTERTADIFGNGPTERPYSLGTDGRGNIYICGQSRVMRIVPLNPDCNGNGIPDGCELLAGAAPDVNHNWIIDSCENPWPCNPDFDQDGDVGTDADITAFFQALSGVGPRGADFNGDGDVGTDADIESFFRRLAGGPC